MSFRYRFPVLSYWLGKKYTLFQTFFYRKNPVKWTLKTYKKRFGIDLDLKKPLMFHEKMNYWKHFYFNPLQTTLADKLEVKKYLCEKGFGDICAKCLFNTDNIKALRKWFKENSNNLPQFVLKTNHSCGDVFIYNNGLFTKKYGRTIKNANKVFRMLKIGLKYNHYYSCFEKPYKDIKPTIFVEEYIDFGNNTTEYEMMSNYGNIVAAKIVRDRQNPSHSEATVDSNFKIIHRDKGFEKEKFVKKPEHLELIKRVINEVCSFAPFCRADFIESNGKLYFCEFTFVKSGGINLYRPYEIEKRMGEIFNL